MPRIISFTVREKLFAEDGEIVPIFLATFTHPDLEAPVRLSSDTTQRLTAEDDPDEIWGTVSEGEDFWFAAMSAILPDSREDQPPSTTLVFANVHPDILTVVKAIRTPASVDLAVTSSANPDAIMWRHLNFETDTRSADEGSVQIEVSRRLFFMEPWPCFFMTKNYFPAMYR